MGIPGRQGRAGQEGRQGEQVRRCPQGLAPGKADSGPRARPGRVSGATTYAAVTGEGRELEQQVREGACGISRMGPSSAAGGGGSLLIGLEEQRRRHGGQWEVGLTSEDTRTGGDHPLPSPGPLPGGREAGNEFLHVGVSQAGSQAGRGRGSCTPRAGRWLPLDWHKASLPHTSTLHLG